MFQFSRCPESLCNSRGVISDAGYDSRITKSGNCNDNRDALIGNVNNNQETNKQKSKEGSKKQNANNNAGEDEKDGEDQREKTEGERQEREAGKD